MTLIISASAGDGPTAISALNPGYGYVVISIKKPGSNEFAPLRPLLWWCSELPENGEIVLSSGETVYEEVKAFLDSEGVVFDRPGLYQLYVSMAVRDTYNWSRLVEIPVRDPQEEDDIRASQTLALYDRALFLYLDGANFLEDAHGDLRRFEADGDLASSTAAPAVRLALGMAALRPSLRLLAEARAEPGLDEAERILGVNLERVWSLPGKPLDLPPSSVVRAAELYIEALERVGRDTTTVRQRLAEQFREEESVRERVDRIIRRH